MGVKTCGGLCVGSGVVGVIEHSPIHIMVIESIGFAQV
jgi:hypothetical protein